MMNRSADYIRLVHWLLYIARSLAQARDQYSGCQTSVVTVEMVYNFFGLKLKAVDLYYSRQVNDSLYT